MTKDTQTDIKTLKHFTKNSPNAAPTITSSSAREKMYYSNFFSALAMKKHKYVLGNEGNKSPPTQVGLKSS